MSPLVDLDINHIEVLAGRALSWHRDRVTCTERETDVSVRVADPADLQPVETALRHYAYKTERPTEHTAEPVPYLRVTGWSPEALSARRQALVAAIEQLHAGFESTVDQTIDTYCSLRARGDTPQTARRKAHQHTKPVLSDATGHAAGKATGRVIMPPAPTKPREAPGIGWQITVNYLLDRRIDHLLARHDRLADKALSWAAEHEVDLASPGATERSLEAMQPWITEQRAHLIQLAQGDLYHGANAWTREHTGTVTLRFAWWYSESQDLNNPPELGEAYRQWAAGERSDATGTDLHAGHHLSPPPHQPASPADTPAQPDAPGTRPAADSAARLAAADFPEPFTGSWPPPAPTEPAAGSSAQSLSSPRSRMPYAPR